MFILYRQEVVQSNCMQVLCEALLNPLSTMEVTVETSAALAVLADDGMFSLVKTLTMYDLYN